jgi:transcriptional regulator with XRE-family HTH domain
MTTHEIVLLARVRRLARSGEAQALRLSAGLSLREVAEAIGTAHNTLWLWELGRRAPRGAAALAWAGLLDDLARAESVPA